METINLFIIFLKIGLVSIGGGYAIIPLIQQEVVINHQFISLQQYSHIITISQMTPGPLVINTASFVGLRINGLTGAIAASLGSILFGVIFSILLYNFFKRHHENKMIFHSLKGLRSTSIGLIASASMTILTLSIVKENTLNWISILIFIFSYLLTFKIKNPLIIIVISGLLGYFLY